MQQLVYVNVLRGPQWRAKGAQTEEERHQAYMIVVRFPNLQGGAVARQRTARTRVTRIPRVRRVRANVAARLTAARRRCRRCRRCRPWRTARVRARARRTASALSCAHSICARVCTTNTRVQPSRPVVIAPSTSCGRRNCASSRSTVCAICRPTAARNCASVVRRCRE